mmetsp:Transcript_62545/g.181325  ORF Transcript_62545/g.181325 Transcript_62545/m.181325 type:complete len:116 (+) Transcript_62545:2-349(+)
MTIFPGGCAPKSAFGSHLDRPRAAFEDSLGNLEARPIMFGGFEPSSVEGDIAFVFSEGLGNQNERDASAQHYSMTVLGEDSPHIADSAKRSVANDCSGAVDLPKLRTRTRHMVAM